MFHIFIEADKSFVEQINSLRTLVYSFLLSECFQTRHGKRRKYRKAPVKAELEALISSTQVQFPIISSAMMIFAKHKALRVVIILAEALPQMIQMTIVALFTSFAPV